MSSIAPEHVIALITAAETLLERRKSSLDPIGIEAQHILTLLKPLPPLSGKFTSSTHPITSHIDLALKVGSRENPALISIIAPIIHSLPWKYNYEPRADLPDLGYRMGWAEIIGPEAPYRSRSLCLGLTLIAPDSLYPAHHHPATELYHVISGTATWTLNGVSHVYPPGSFILHPSQSVHAMRTGSHPLLALYTWSGPDVDTLSDYTI